jgi:hypothetical protein
VNISKSASYLSQVPVLAQIADFLVFAEFGKSSEEGNHSFLSSEENGWPHHSLYAGFSGVLPEGTVAGLHSLGLSFFCESSVVGRCLISRCGKIIVF